MMTVLNVVGGYFAVGLVIASLVTWRVNHAEKYDGDFNGGRLEASDLVQMSFIWPVLLFVLLLDIGLWWAIKMWRPSANEPVVTRHGTVEPEPPSDQE